MIAALDALDTDPDFEDGHDAEDDKADAEPSMGACEGRGGTYWNGRGVDDLEPSLGFLECQIGSAAFSFGYRRDSSGDQMRISYGDREDHEDEHDGREAEEDKGIDDENGIDDVGFGVDAEPSLAATEAFDQRHAWSTKTTEPHAVDDGEEDAGDAPELVNEDGDGFNIAGQTATEVTALVRNPDGSETIMRHIGDPLKGLAAVHSAMERGVHVEGILFKARRH